jgi:hypothetical protein
VCQEVGHLHHDYLVASYFLQMRQKRVIDSIVPLSKEMETKLFSDDLIMENRVK